MSLLSIGQIVSSIIIAILILLQEKSSGGMGLFGGDAGPGFYQVRRGLEKFIFISTIVFIVIFAGLALAQLVL